VALFLRRREGLQLLRQRLGDAAIGYRQEGGYELILEDAASVEDAVAALNRLLAPHLGTHPFGMAPEQRAAFGFSAHKVVTMTANYLEGGLNTGRMLRALVDACLRAGIEIKTGAGVTGFEDRPNGVLVALAGDPLREPLTLESQTLCLCTNAFTRQLLPDVDVRPGRGQVLITHPIPGLRFKGIFHFDRGYYYFRELDGRVLIGGGRNLDFEGEATTSFALSERIQQDLEYWLREVILPDTPFEIDLRWSGIMAFGTTTKAPIVQAFGHRVFGGFRMGGMGVALGSATARELATLVRASVG
jgi:glycine/D-amino acid oxidase-like deaminating enzyme